MRLAHGILTVVLGVLVTVVAIGAIGTFVEVDAETFDAHTRHIRRGVQEHVSDGMDESAAALLRDIALRAGVDQTINGAGQLARWVRQKWGAALIKGGGASVTNRSAAVVASRIAARVAARAVLASVEVIATCANPVGWAIDAAGGVGMALDLWDPQGYANWTANAELAKTTVAIQREHSIRAFAQEKRHPELMGPWDVDADIAKEVFTRVMSRLMMNALMRLPEKALEAHLAKTVDEVIRGARENPDTDTYDLQQKVDAVQSHDLDRSLKKQFHVLFPPRCRDIILTRELNDAHARANTGYTFELVDAARPSGQNFSSRTEFGIALTGAGADLWNKRHKTEWLQTYDLFRDVSQVSAFKGGDCSSISRAFDFENDDYQSFAHSPLHPKDEQERRRGEHGDVDRNDAYNNWKVPDGFRVTLFEDAQFKGRSVTILKDTHLCDIADGYFVGKVSSVKVERIAPFPLAVPTAMHTDSFSFDDGPFEFSRKITFKAFLGPVYSYCEKKRQAKQHGASVTPSQYGVHFDFSKGMCIMSKEYCDRMGMDYDADAAGGNGDCKLTLAQKACESLAGATGCRDVKEHPVTGTWKIFRAVQGGLPGILGYIASFGSW